MTKKSPRTHVDIVHGVGGKSTHKLVQDLFQTRLKNPELSPHDAAKIAIHSRDLIVSTDSHVITPIIFPGGNIGKLSVSGTINDMLCQGGEPRWISMGFILEEGLSFQDLEVILDSIQFELDRHSIHLICADTKVLPARSANPGIFISSTLFGTPIPGYRQLNSPQVNDAILVSGPLGEHALAILAAREKLPFALM